MNAAEHRLGSAILLGSLAASLNKDPEKVVTNTAVVCAGGYCFATLPDMLEPATNPHHRQFFHGLVFAGALGYGLYKLYQWGPESPEGRFLRAFGLIAGGSYLIHLAFDATTKRSLPLVGRL